MAYIEKIQVSINLGDFIAEALIKGKIVSEMNKGALVEVVDGHYDPDKGTINSEQLNTDENGVVARFKSGQFADDDSMEFTKEHFDGIGMSEMYEMLF